MAECVGMKLAVHVDATVRGLDRALDAALEAGCSAVEIGAGGRVPAMAGAAAVRARELRLCALACDTALAEGLEVAAAIGAPALVLPAGRLPAVAGADAVDLGGRSPTGSPPSAGAPLAVYVAARAGTGDLGRVRPASWQRLAAVLAWAERPVGADEPVSPGAIAAEIDRCQAWVEHVHIVGSGSGWLGPGDRPWLMPALRVLHRIGYEGYLVLRGPAAATEALSAAVQRLREWVEEAWTA